MWVGVPNAPKTTILSVYGKKSEKIGIGGSVYNDEAAALSRIGGNISYAYHTKLTININLSLSLQAGFLQHKIIKDGLTGSKLEDPLF